MEIKLLPGERLDDLHRNGFQIIQNKEKFCFGMDAVLLSGFARVKPGEMALDLGTGTGIIPILLAAKTRGKAFYGPGDPAGKRGYGQAKRFAQRPGRADFHCGGGTSEKPRSVLTRLLLM